MSKLIEQRLQELEKEIAETGIWKSVELQILDGDCNNTRTFLRVNEKLRLAIFQIYYAKTNITTKASLVRIPQQYAPQENDLNWFTGSHSNGGTTTGRFTINSDGAVAVLATATNTNYLFGRITYNF